MAPSKTMRTAPAAKKGKTSGIMNSVPKKAAVKPVTTQATGSKPPSSIATVSKSSSTKATGPAPEANGTALNSTAIDQSQEEQPSGEVQSATATNFPRFNELALEIRLRIWGYAAPEPVVIVQRISEKGSGSFTYRRLPPAILHACRESRYEYLDADIDDAAVSVARRRRDHPVYKLEFKNSRTRASPGFFFSVDIDTLWGVLRPSRAVRRRGRYYSGDIGLLYQGLANLDLAKHLKHLAMEDRLRFNLAGNAAAFLQRYFPSLKTLTVPFDVDHFNKMYTKSLIPPPEKNGEMDLDALKGDGSSQTLAHIWWEPPVVKMRFKSQFDTNAVFAS
ncbi:hypothetical protein LSUE1_G003312 [Lachnellula suecica]|uniref:2EXR domain-containing protein n=1 Tax=Lachnellula suecica TaxID=602035 RepID=A0A8T9CDJ3_9HELO|nr:hypothetical protein LSUE1_G003312 [Lachnellula suecica]